MPRRATSSSPATRALTTAALVFTTLAICTQPQRRHYDTHTYYVLQTTEHSNLSPAQLAQAVGAEYVERVGELDHHWLVRSLKPLVSARTGGAQRDAVIERWQYLKQRHLIARGHDGWERRVVDSIVDIERQYLQKRHKRDVIYIPTLDGKSVRSLSFEQRQEEDVDGQVTKELLTSIEAKRFGFVDPQWPEQWHLVNDQMPENSVNVTDVWGDGFKGKGINVAIVDDGLDMHSDDLAFNFFYGGSWDYNDHTPLPEPRLPDDQHGTRCAGEIAAGVNNVCGVGVAHESKVAGIRILSAAISDADEASALNYAYQQNHIYSCSWGPPDDGRSMEAPSRLIHKAILNGVQKGRDGKGSIFVFASGNGASADDQCNFDGYTNSIYSITVSAIDRKGIHPYYSEVCSANMVVTYSSGSGDNIHTTDVGKNKCTSHHGGTSAAAPLGAGIFALALQVRPDLTWRDMQHLAVNTAVHILPDDPDWQKTATGRLYNHKFGWGKLDAWAIVEAAKQWTLVKPQAWYMTPNKAVDASVTSEGAVSTIQVTQEEIDGANFERLEHVTIAVNIQHGRRGNVEVVLTSPHGSHSVLARPRRFDDATTGFPNWVFMSVKHWGENAVGTWTLRVFDSKQEKDKNGTFENWSLGFWGECHDASQQELFKMPDDAQIHLPPSPTVTTTDQATETGGSTTASASTSLTEVVPIRPTKPQPSNPPPKVSDSDMKTSKTKSVARPTEHLPEDHAGTSQPTTSKPKPTSSSIGGGGQQEDLTSLGSGVSTLLGKTSSWAFLITGGFIILMGGSFAFCFLLRRQRRQQQHQRQDHARPGGYDFEPVSGLADDDVAMTHLDTATTTTTQNQQSRLTLPLQSTSSANAGGSGSGGKTTRDLYDAFGVTSDIDEDDEDDDERRGGTRIRGISRERVRLRRSESLDDHYRDTFLANEATPLSCTAHANDSSTSLPRREVSIKPVAPSVTTLASKEEPALFDIGDED